MMAVKPTVYWVFRFWVERGVVGYFEKFRCLARSRGQTVCMLQSDGRVVQRQTLEGGHKRVGFPDGIYDPQKNMDAKAREAELCKQLKLDVR
jgi:hypothetical protein